MKRIRYRKIVKLVIMELIVVFLLSKLMRKTNFKGINNNLV